MLLRQIRPELGFDQRLCKQWTTHIPIIVQLLLVSEHFPVVCLLHGSVLPQLELLLAEHQGTLHTESLLFSFLLLLLLLDKVILVNLALKGMLLAHFHIVLDQSLLLQKLFLYLPSVVLLQSVTGHLKAKFVMTGHGNLCQVLVVDLVLSL